MSCGSVARVVYAASLEAIYIDAIRGSIPSAAIDFSDTNSSIEERKKHFGQRR